MFLIGRNGLRKINRRTLSAAVQASTPASSSNSHAIGDRKFVRNYRNNRKPFMSATPIEQIKLQEKYNEHLKNNKLETLHEAIEFVEWRGTVYVQTIAKIVSLLEQSSDLSSLSDRQLAVLLSAFGGNCDTVSRSKRASFLEKAEAILTNKGVLLGLQSRNRLIECKIDNHSQIDAVEELGKFEESGVEPDSKSYALLCEIYAKQANTKAITDIIGYMKGNGMALNEDHVTQLIYSIAKSGKDAQVSKVVETFANSMNVVRLRCAAARAIIQREKDEPGKGGFEATEMLRAIPTTAKIHSLDNNGYVVNVLMDLIEVGQLDAFKLLSSYLIVSPDGSYLADNHLNSSLVARAKSMLCEGNLAEAMALYSCVNPTFANEYFVREFKQNLEQQLQNVTDATFDKFLQTLKLAEQKGLITNVNQFLLNACAFKSIPAFLKVFDYVKKDLREVLAENVGLKKPLARQFGHLLIKSPSPAQQAQYLANVALILFAPCESEESEHIFDFYSIVFKLGGGDVKLAIPALELITDFHEKRELATAFVNGLLKSVNDDHLAVDKILKLLESKNVDTLNGYRLYYVLTKFFISSGGKDGNIDPNRLQLVAKILSFDFAPSDSQSLKNSRLAARNLAKFLANDMISDEKCDQLIGLLEKENRALLSLEQLTEAREIFKGSAKKAEMIYRLKKSQTASRWRSSQIEELIQELANFKPESPKGVVRTLREVILQRTIAEKHDVNFLLQVLESAVEWKKDDFMNQNKLKPKFFKDLCKNLEIVTLSKALKENNMVLADRIWLMRSSHLSADVSLSYAAKLFLNGQKERADEVCEDLRSSAQQIRASTLEKMGRKLEESDLAKMDELAAYLKKQFNLNGKDTGRIVLQAKLDKLEKMIQSGSLDEALKMAVEETNSSKRAFGQMPIMIEAIRTNNRKVLESVHLMVKSAHSQDVANLNLAYALLHCNHVEQAKQLIEKQNLKIEDNTMNYFTTLAVASENVQTAKNLFLVFNGRASTVQLNNLLENVTRTLWKSGDFESLQELNKEIDATSFPLQIKLRKFFDNLERKNTELEKEL